MLSDSELAAGLVASRALNTDSCQVFFFSFLYSLTTRPINGIASFCDAHFVTMNMRQAFCFDLLHFSLFSFLTSLNRLLDKKVLKWFNRSIRTRHFF